MSSVTDVVSQYFDAWNQQDVPAILVTFNPNGTYSDPAAGNGLQGQAIADYAQGLFTAFPDMRLELVSNQIASNQMVVAPWILFGTHQGELSGNPATGKSVELLGCDFITCSGGRIDAVKGLFDSEQLMQQLGLSS